jgi:FMN phosphatase YigB (HAD superfamily)
MIGNDVRDDIAPAASVGIRTFWLQGSKYEQAADLPDVPADFRGTLADLERLIFGAGDLSLKR